MRAVICQKLDRNRQKSTLKNFLRKTLGLTDIKFALLKEFGSPYFKSAWELAYTIKNLRVIDGNYPIGYSISTKGGVAKNAVTKEIMFTELPGVFCAVEILDWAAPRGGVIWLDVCTLVHM